MMIEILQIWQFWRLSCLARTNNWIVA